MSAIFMAKLLASVEALQEAHSALGYSGRSVNATDGELLRDEIHDELAGVVSTVADAAEYLAESFAWVPVSSRIPEAGVSVALINVNEWENAGPNGPEMNVRAAGRLTYYNNDVPGWNVCGRRIQSLNAFTHWTCLPEPPK